MNGGRESINTSKSINQQINLSMLGPRRMTFQEQQPWRPSCEAVSTSPPTPPGRGSLGRG